jgi:RNA polymerase sigma factor (sigma-70 family)
MRVRIIARFKNANFAEAIEEQGFKTQKAFADHYGFFATEVGRWLNFKSYPRRDHLIDRIEKATKRLFEDLFPKEYRDAVDRELGRPIQKTVEVFELPAGFQPKYLLDSPQNLYEKKQLSKMIAKLLKKRLPPRYYLIIKHRFGLDGFEELSMEEIGKLFKVTPERIRQIEARALRIMKRGIREELSINDNATSWTE